MTSGEKRARVRERSAEVAAASGSEWERRGVVALRRAEEAGARRLRRRALEVFREAAILEEASRQWEIFDADEPLRLRRRAAKKKGEATNMIRRAERAETALEEGGET